MSECVNHSTHIINVAPEKKLEQELSEMELAKVAGGIPPRAGTSGTEI